MMTIGLMQPYVFPYIGYFQLIQSVDKFIFYDDVNFIKQGWINRNRILLNGNEHLFSVPLSDASSFVLINETRINSKIYDSWKQKFYKTIAQGYAKAPYFTKVNELIKNVFEGLHTNIAELSIESILQSMDYLGMQKAVIPSSTIYNNAHLKKQERVIDICKKEQADHYINPIGGVALYAKDSFEQVGIKLNFIKSSGVRYQQLNNEFVPWLSIIDVMMFNAPEEIAGMLGAYELE